MERERKKERNKTRGNEVNRKEGRDCSSNLGNVTHTFVEIISSASPDENAICLLSFPFQILLFPKSDSFVPYKLQSERGDRAQIIIITV